MYQTVEYSMFRDGRYAFVCMIYRPFDISHAKYVNSTS